MPGPIVFVSKHKIKEGKLEWLKENTPERMSSIEASKPGTVFQNAYLNEDESVASFVHVFPDAAAMAQHMVGAADRSEAAFEYLEPMSMEIFGSPNEQVVQMFRQIEDRGVKVTYLPRHVAGFIRLLPAE